MGFRDFFKYLKSIGFIGDRECFISASAKLIVDVKNMMYRFGYYVPTDTEDFAQAVAVCIFEAFKGFDHVVFVNDGTINESHPKFATTVKRSEQKKDARARVEKRKADVDPNDEKEMEQVDRAERAARGVSFEHSKAILEHLKQYPNFECVQCEDGEADDYIIKHSSQFDFVVSEDSDFLIGGVTCLLHKFATQNQCVYRTADVLAFLKLSQVQLQEMSAMAGNDYTQIGIRGMGAAKAHALLLKYGNCKTMLAQWTPKERKPFSIPDEFYSNFNRSMQTYSHDDPAVCFLDVPKKEETPTITTTNTQRQHDTYFSLFDSSSQNSPEAKKIKKRMTG